ncbi:hypothetical protein VP01_282g3 [Puccinia sorghi]|uniref:Uncharacterized protein n=1 Tax=Puccinia sorghi TaxID=27349 RepID=A0A0L6V296_9BASI|nr:hypothetical protein VP01_282g3 [Puccinia sorghi]
MSDLRGTTAEKFNSCEKHQVEVQPENFYFFHPLILFFLFLNNFILGSDNTKVLYFHLSTFFSYSDPFIFLVCLKTQNLTHSIVDPHLTNKTKLNHIYIEKWSKIGNYKPRVYFLSFLLTILIARLSSTINQSRSPLYILFQNVASCSGWSNATSQHNHKKRNCKPNIKNVCQNQINNQERLPGQAEIAAIYPRCMGGFTYHLHDGIEFALCTFSAGTCVIINYESSFFSGTHTNLNLNRYRCTVSIFLIRFSFCSNSSSLLQVCSTLLVSHLMLCVNTCWFPSKSSYTFLFIFHFHQYCAFFLSEIHQVSFCSNSSLLLQVCSTLLVSHLVSFHNYHHQQCINHHQDRLGLQLLDCLKVAIRIQHPPLNIHHNPPNNLLGFCHIPTRWSLSTWVHFSPQQHKNFELAVNLCIEINSLLPRLETRLRKDKNQHGKRWTERNNHMRFDGKFSPINRDEDFRFEIEKGLRRRSKVQLSDIVEVKVDGRVREEDSRYQSKANQRGTFQHIVAKSSKDGVVIKTVSSERVGFSISEQSKCNERSVLRRKAVFWKGHFNTLPAQFLFRVLETDVSTHWNSTLAIFQQQWKQVCGIMKVIGPLSGLKIHLMHSSPEKTPHLISFQYKNQQKPYNIRDKSHSARRPILVDLILFISIKIIKLIFWTLKLSISFHWIEGEKKRVMRAHLELMCSRNNRCAMLNLAPQRQRTNQKFHKHHTFNNHIASKYHHPICIPHLPILTQPTHTLQSPHISTKNQLLSCQTRTKSVSSASPESQLKKNESRKNQIESLPEVNSTTIFDSVHQEKIIEEYLEILKKQKNHETKGKKFQQIPDPPSGIFTKPAVSKTNFQELIRAIGYAVSLLHNSLSLKQLLFFFQSVFLFIIKLGLMTKNWPFFILLLSAFIDFLITNNPLRSVPEKSMIVSNLDARNYIPLAATRFTKFVKK